MYLGSILGNRERSIDLGTIKVITKWTMKKTLTDVISYLGDFKYLRK